MMSLLRPKRFPLPIKIMGKPLSKESKCKKYKCDGDYHQRCHIKVFIHNFSLLIRRDFYFITFYDYIERRLKEDIQIS